jgi:hypothetical protein
MENIGTTMREIYLTIRLMQVFFESFLSPDAAALKQQVFVKTLLRR